MTALKAPVVHRLGDGTPVTVGLRVIDYDRDHGTVTKVSERGPCEPGLSGMCDGWHTVLKDNGGTMIFNCPRLARLTEVTQ